jgi:endonuclease/exonuclease/phosphatase family metal-dependent hydrolase
MRPLTNAALATGALLALACSSAGGRSGERIARVMIYNIHAGKDAKGVDNLARVAKLVDSVRADVVLLQEVDRNTARSGNVDQPAELARLTGYHVVFGKSLDYQGGDYGIAIMSRWRITSDTAIHLPVDPPQERSGGSYEPRIAVRAIIDAPGAPIAFVNTHLDPSGDDRWRKQEIRTVLDIVDALRKRGIATFAGGDFNSTPESSTQTTVRAAGLRDSWTMCGQGDSLTYPADTPAKRIDYLFLTGSASCTGASVVATEASDHRPLLVIVRGW